MDGQKISINFSNGGGGAGQICWHTGFNRQNNVEFQCANVEGGKEMLFKQRPKLLCYGTYINSALLRRVCDECVMAGTPILRHTVTAPHIVSQFKPMCNVKSIKSVFGTTVFLYSLVTPTSLLVIILNWVCIHKKDRHIPSEYTYWSLKQAQF